MVISVQSLKNHQLFIPALTTFLILLLTSVLFFFYRKFRVRADTILFVGLTESGKTTLFNKLINPENRWTSFISLKENRFTNYKANNGKTLILLDYPGSESYKKALYRKWFNQDRKSLNSVIFIVDSVKFNKKDVAEFLYDVLYELKGKVPVLVACNKQDVGHAKAVELIKKSLEQEFGLINVSREAALSSTSGEAEKRILTNTGKAFVWTDLKGHNLEFAECAANENDNYTMGPIREWIESI